MTAATAPFAAPERTPSVLAVLVVRDAAEWLRESLQALAAQSYPRLGIFAIDDASTDGSSAILLQALGEGRVIRHDERRGVSRAIDEVLALPVVAAADLLLVVHDDVALDPEAVARMVEATQLAGAERVGIVGSKVVDWDAPRRLLDVGRSADRFGHPYTPLQADEIDQGQFDRVLEVLSVDSCAMLVTRELWQSIGLFDERLGDDDGDLDLGWRAHVAGWKVLMTPLARVRHRAAAERDDRPGIERSRRYEEDRAALAGVLKNYSLATLLWLVPFGFTLSVVRAVFLILGRRFDEAYDLLAAMGWNLGHLPGTWQRRRRVQRARRTKDHQLRRFTESAGLHLPRWFQTAEKILEEQRELEQEDEGKPASRRLRHRTASLFSQHPVIVTSSFAILIGIFSVRHLIGPQALWGGVFPRFPASAGGFFHELAAGYRSTGLGGSLPASPALAAMGSLSVALGGSTALAQKVMLGAGPALAGILAYRAAMRLTGRPGPAAIAAFAYAVSAVMLWAFSEGRIGLLVVLAVLPALLERFEVAFNAEVPVDGRWRFITGVGVTLAIGIAFAPGILLAVGLLAVVHVLASRRRLTGLVRTAAALAVAAALSFTWIPALLAGGGAALGSRVGAQDPWSVLRLVLGPAPGAWIPSLFLPVAAVLGLALSSGAHRAPAVRAGLLATASLALAWLSAAGRLPGPFADAPAYAAMAAGAEALVVACGLASVLGGLGRESFGFRQIGTALLTVVLGLGLLLQSAAIATADWAVGGPNKIAAAWAVVDSQTSGEFRVLWLAAGDGSHFPAPGGDPAGIAPAGPATVAFGVTDRVGAEAIDVGRPLAGPGADALRATLGEVLGGTTTHAGALLAPFGVSYVVAGDAGFPVAARDRLQAQADLDLIPATGLLIWRNAAAIPPAAVLRATDEVRTVVAASDAEHLQRFVPPALTPLRRTGNGWAGLAGAGGLAVLSTEFSMAWHVDGTSAQPSRAFGWATALDVPAGEVAILGSGGVARSLGIGLLTIVWLAGLWITRKPARR